MHQRGGLPAGTRQHYGNQSGVAFSNGVAIAITKLVGDSDTTVLVANDVVCNIDYQ